MHVEKVADSIDMIAAFKNGKIKPLVFLWRGRRIKDLQVKSTWEVRQGEGKQIFFNLSHQNDTIYKVYLDTRSWRWTLESVFSKWL